MTNFVDCILRRFDTHAVRIDCVAYNGLCSIPIRHYLWTALCTRAGGVYPKSGGGQTRRKCCREVSSGIARYRCFDGD